MKIRYHMTTCYLESCCVTFNIEQIERGKVQSLLDAGWDIKKRDRFTGLTDKNGTEVYEGDILFDEPDEFFNETRNLFIVEWLENECGFAFHRNKTRIYENSSDLISDNTGTLLLQVIGNIHDNPELLESEGK